MSKYQLSFLILLLVTSLFSQDRQSFYSGAGYETTLGLDQSFSFIMQYQRQIGKSRYQWALRGQLSTEEQSFQHTYVSSHPEKEYLNLLPKARFALAGQIDVPSLAESEFEILHDFLRVDLSTSALFGREWLIEDVFLFSAFTGLGLVYISQQGLAAGGVYNLTDERFPNKEVVGLLPAYMRVIEAIVPISLRPGVLIDEKYLLGVEGNLNLILSGGGTLYLNAIFGLKF